MSNNSVSFASVEQITSRPNYSSNVNITVENFHTLIGRYHLSESVQCQVKSDHGICGKKHQIGYVGVTQNGMEGLIGGYCGDKYFGESTIFVQEKNRIDAELDRRENLEKLLNYKENFFSLTSHYNELKKSIELIKKRANHLYKGFPDIVLIYLNQAQKTKNWDLYIDVLRHSRGEKGMTSNWYIEKLCTFAPLPSSQDYESLLGRIENLIDVFNEVCSTDIDLLSTPKLKGFVRTLSEFTDVENLYTKYNKDTVDFTQEKSLNNLYYVCANTKDKLATVKTIMTLNKNVAVKDDKIKLRCTKIEESTKSKFNYCTVRFNKIIMKFKKNKIG
ncbi:hypothetical protein [Rahnella perminowiae]|uniref:hypothetical protein n=1 Tax=Rahnella perminowiae TaxID=2816244 RepID=UPI00300E9B58